MPEHTPAVTGNGKCYKGLNMTIKIHKFLKEDLGEVAEIDVLLANTTGMTISHYACNVISSMAPIPFTFEGVEKYVPIIKDVEFCTVIRKKVDLTAIGQNSEVIKDIGEDIGKYNYVNSVPKSPVSLPQGFQEIYKNK